MNSLKLSCRPIVSAHFTHYPPSFNVWVGDTAEPSSELARSYLRDDKYNLVRGWENVQLIKKESVKRT